MQLVFRAHQESLNQNTVVGLASLAGIAPWIPGQSTSGPGLLPSRDESHRFKIRMANSDGRRISASYLIQKMYSWRGYATSPLRNDEPSRITLVASDEECVVGTITVGLDSTQGLYVDDLYRDKLDGLRAAGARICEFSKLAVDRSQQSKELLAVLFHIAYIFARQIHDRSDLLIEVNPRHVRFYERMLGFRQFGPELTNKRVNASAVLMRLDLDHPEEQIALHGGKRESTCDKRSLYPYFFSPSEEVGIAARLRLMG